MARTPEQVREAKRLHMARRRAADPEAARAYGREHHRRNRERQLASMRAYYSRRFFWGRAMKLRRPGKATASDLAGLWHSQRGRCALTGRCLTRDNAHLDHIVALANGGGDEPSNLRWLCHEANLAKRALSDAAFIALCSDVMHWIGRRIQMVDDLTRALEATA